MRRYKLVYDYKFKLWRCWLSEDKNTSTSEFKEWRTTPKEPNRNLLHANKKFMVQYYLEIFFRKVLYNRIRKEKDKMHFIPA